MNKLSFFLYLANNGYFKYKKILMSLFTVLDKDVSITINKISTVTYTDKLIYSLGDEQIVITWAKENEPLYTAKERVIVESNLIENLTDKVETSYGRILINQLLLLENGIKHLDYNNNDWIRSGTIYAVMKKLATDEVVTDKQAHDFINALTFVSSLTQYFVPAASEKSMTSNPNIPKRKKELLEKYKDKLDDPAVISNIEQELIQMDKDWIKGDISEGFYKSGKDYNVSRKRLFIMHGGEKSFIDDAKIDIISFSLEEGWDLNELPKVANSLRDGSYGRGAATAMGGERVKKFQQTFQNSRISMDDCGTKKGAIFNINTFNYKQFIGRIDMKGNILTDTILKSYIGKVIEIRSPLYCLAAKTDYCKTCMGMMDVKNPNIINTLTATIGSVFMLIEMKATHGKELLTNDFDIENCIN